MTNSMWVVLIYLPGIHLIHVSSHVQQDVSGIYLFARWSHHSYLILWLTVCEWHSFICLPSSLTNHVSSHYQQDVSSTATPCLGQAVSSIMPFPMMNRMWSFISLLGSINHVLSHDQQYVSDTDIYLFFNYVSSHDQQQVSSITRFLGQVVSSIMSHPMNNSLWVTLWSCGFIMSHPMTNRK